MADELGKIDRKTDKVDSGSKSHRFLSRVMKKFGVIVSEASTSNYEADANRSPPMSRSKRHPMVRALRALVKGSKLQDLERNMNRAEQTLQTGILRQLWYAVFYIRNIKMIGSLI